MSRSTGSSPTLRLRLTARSNFQALNIPINLTTDMRKPNRNKPVTESPEIREVIRATRSAQNPAQLLEMLTEEATLSNGQTVFVAGGIKMGQTSCRGTFQGLAGQGYAKVKIGDAVHTVSYSSLYPIR